MVGGGSIPSRSNEIFNILIFSVWCRGKALSPATQHAMPAELGGKLGTECLSTGFARPTLLCAGYSVKLVKFLIINYHSRVTFFFLCNF